jgi:hypothetical protein
MIDQYSKQAKKALEAQNRAQALMTTGHLWMQTEIEATTNFQREFNEYLDKFHDILGFAAEIYGIYFFINYRKMPYDIEGNMLFPEYEEGPETHHKKLTGRVYRTEAGRAMKDQAELVEEPAYWLGKYSVMPHVLSFLNHDYTEIFEVLRTDPEVYPLLGPFMTAFENKAMEQLEGMIGTLRVQTSRLSTK